MNILAIDFGTKNIGLAWCNEALGVVLPFGVIKDKGIKSKEQMLVELIKKEGIDKVVIGMPIGVGGLGEKNMERVKKFADELKKYISLPIEFVDERFSSQQADRMEGGASSRDEKSAMIILESYLGKK